MAEDDRAAPKDTPAAAEAVTIERTGAVAVVTLHRPLSRNAMDRALVEQCRAALLSLDGDDAVRAVLLRGAAPGFCAGSDLKFISALALEAMSRFEQECGDLGRLMAFLSKPIIAAVEGFAIGGGFTLAACCDYVVAGRTSKWSLPEVPLGWLTPWGLKALIARVGPVRARTLCWCVAPMTGEQAREAGLVDHVCDDGDAEAEALRIAAQIAALPAPAVAATKRFFSSHVLKDAETMDYEANRLFVENCRSTEARRTFAKFGSAAVA